MKRLICLLLVLTFCCCLCACTPDNGPTDTLNVMSFNVYSVNKNPVNTNNGDPVDMRVKRRAPCLNELLLGEQIDIAGLQEASEAWQNWLKTDLDSAYSYVGTHTVKTGEGGYIVYNKEKLTLMEDSVFWLAEGAPRSSEIGWDGQYDRLCTWALFQVKETGKYLLFMDTHLDHKGTLARTYGAKLILDQIALLRTKFESTYGVTDCPVVVVGDMNAEPSSAAYKKFTSGLVDSFYAVPNNPFDEDASTSPGLYYRTSEDAYVIDSHRIDYVFLSKENITALKYNMLHTSSSLCKYGEFLSDHNAIVVHISITN